MMSETHSNSLEIPLLHDQQKLEKIPHHGVRAHSMHEIHMVCFTALDHHDEGDDEPVLNDDYSRRYLCSSHSTLQALTVTLILPVLLSIQFYLAYQFPNAAADTGLSLAQAQTILALYTVACLSYRLSCPSAPDQCDMHLYLMPEIVSDAIALMLLLHYMWLGVTVTSIFAIAFALAAVSNTISCMRTEEGVRVIKGNDDGDLDVTHHNHLFKPSLV